jgi:hypothetical protein
MSQFWLTPVTIAPFVVLGDERTKVAGAAWEAFRRRLNAVHPRLLPLFKARLLPGDSGGQLGEADEAGGAGTGASCGAAAHALELGVPGAIAFDGTLFTLSHCGEAFFARLLLPREALWLAEPLAGGALTGQERGWLDAMCRWWRQERFVILLA